MKLPIKIEGIVIEGKHVGEKNGFPTANIKLEQNLEPGIYAGITYVDRKEHLSAIYVGPSSNILETHILDFQGSLYSQKISVKIDKKIRDPITFKDRNHLVNQISEDIKIINSFYQN